jgi:hypothetical protein
MSLFKDGLVQISLGETLIGTDDAILDGGPARLINTRMEGREGWISHEDVLNHAGVSISPGTGARTLVRVVRNMTGGDLYAGEIVKINPAAGIVGFGRVTAKTSANDRLAFVVDPTLTASGVKDKDLFLVCVRGPAKVLAPAAGVALASAGLPLIAGASGRAAAGGDTAGSSKLILGTFLTGIMLATANENALLPVVLHPDWN